MLYPIEDLYIRRMKGVECESEYYSYELDTKVRSKIIGTFFDYRFIRGMSDLERHAGIAKYDEFVELVKILEREFGERISSSHGIEDKLNDFLSTCADEKFLSALEVLLSIKFINTKIYGRNCELASENKLISFIETINGIFKIDKVGYEIVSSDLPKLPFIIMPFNSEYLHDETINKPLILMRDAEFKGPLNEFEKALDEYRNEEYEDTIHEATKAYESTLKTIMDLKGIEYGPSDNTIPKLVEKIRKEGDIIKREVRSSFDSFWSVLQNGPPSIRNMQGIAHGQGNDIKEIQKSYANFVLRLTGTYIVFLIERYNETK